MLFISDFLKLHFEFLLRFMLGLRAKYERKLMHKNLQAKTINEVKYKAVTLSKAAIASLMCVVLCYTFYIDSIRPKFTTPYFYRHEIVRPCNWLHLLHFGILGYKSGFRCGHFNPDNLKLTAEIRIGQ